VTRTDIVTEYNDDNVTKNQHFTLNIDRIEVHTLCSYTQLYIQNI